MPSSAEVLNGYIERARDTELSAEVMAKAAQHTLDSIAAIVSGAQMQPGKAGLDYVVRQASSLTSSSVLGSACRSSPTLAALANGMSAHADETDDSHEMSLSHPGCSIVPAAFAVAEAEDCTVAELLRAVALGYDIGPRVILAVGRDYIGGPPYNIFSSHAYANVFGAAAASACLWRLNRQQVAWALSYAAQQASGLSTWVRDRNHVEKAFVFGGMPARNGVGAAEVVHFGWDGVDDTLTGSQGFLQILSPKPDPSQLTDGLGERFEISRTNIKKYSVGSPAQSVLQALEELLAENPIDVSAVESIRVALAPDLASVMDGRSMPDVNVQYLVSAMLIDGRFSFEMSHSYERMQKPDVRALIAKVDLVADPSIAPRARQAHLVIRLKGGRVLEKRVKVVRGAWQDPMSDEEVVAKARDLMEPVLTSGPVSAAIAMLMGPDKSGSVRELARLLRSA